MEASDDVEKKSTVDGSKSEDVPVVEAGPAVEASDDVEKGRSVKENLNDTFAEFSNVGIKFGQMEYFSDHQDLKFLPDKIASLPKNQAKMLQLYCDALYYKSMSELYKMQQEMSVGRSRTLSSNGGFSNVISLIISLVVIVLVGVIIFLCLK